MTAVIAYIREGTLVVMYKDRSKKFIVYADFYWSWFSGVQHNVHSRNYGSDLEPKMHYFSVSEALFDPNWYVVQVSEMISNWHPGLPGPNTCGHVVMMVGFFSPTVWASRKERIRGTFKHVRLFIPPVSTYWQLSSSQLSSRLRS